MKFRPHAPTLHAIHTSGYCTSNSKCSFDKIYTTVVLRFFVFRFDGFVLLL